MKNITKYALAAALVLPSVFSIGAKEAKADSVVINKEVADAVNVRSSAEEKDNVIGLINDENRSYEILGKANGFFKIDFEGREAFVGTPWFNVTKETEVLAPSNFRKEDNLSSEIIKVVAEGSKVEVLGEGQNGYVKVKFEGQEGYIYNNLLRSFKEKKQEAKKEAPAQQAPQTQSQQTYEEPSYDYYEETTYYEEPADAYYEEEVSYQGDSNWAKEWIAQRESGGSYTAYNPAGGYYGRYQLNPSLVSYGASPAEQEAAADAYVAQRYGSWENAQAFWANNGWY
ncbi:SH3 domain-containing protein [Anaerococcus vaginimassiliensis]|uniref:aggregation-promoting factor C-terminal-like domain-containing protein n=1 Tax=Anaerococcus vaginimassiliensis TaxID=2042308 RepID=UPI001031A9A9|nr:SH3 domain-containing protein [Anaerococcus vaginimassiliensis]